LLQEYVLELNVTLWFTEQLTGKMNIEPKHTNMHGVENPATNFPYIGKDELITNIQENPGKSLN
jgi:hypothetical protein